MRLSFSRPYLSIIDFPTIELPKFTLVTGANGSGKTHLLEAIRDGSIANSIPGFQPNTAPLYNWSNLVPQNAQVASSAELSSRKENVWQQIKNTQLNSYHRNNLFTIASNIGIPSEYLRDIGGFLSHSDDEIRAMPFFQQRPDLLSLIRAQAAVWESDIYTTAGNLEAVREICKRLGKSPVALTRDDLFESSFLDWTTSTNVFQLSFSNLFIAYRDRLTKNNFRRLKFGDGESDQPGLTPAEFRVINGPPPWEFVNDALAAASIGFKIDHPDLYSATNYTPRLTKIQTGKEVAFDKLSSGEKIIMSFAFCVYSASDERQLFTKSPLILLDEVDAPLHPSMKRNFISTIIETLVSKYCIDVIATTHSPSSVALAPGESLYIMQGETLGLRKASKGEALNILTVGVPSMAIAYEGRRQVFVESPADAAVYEKLYQLLKNSLVSERSLSFISTFSKAKNGQEENTGCDVVRRIVSELVREGNKTVFGLLDWDNKRTPDERVRVLAEGRRDGLENIILDPLLLAAFLKKMHQTETKTYPTLSRYTFVSLLNAKNSELQLIADEISSHVFGDAKTESMECCYLGRFSLMIDKRCLLTDDHAYEEKVVTTMPFLKRYSSGGAGKLMMAVVENIVFEHPSFTPDEITRVFLEILEAPAH